MSMMMDDGLPLTPEQQAAQLLAYYDARGVSGPKLRKIFRCSDEALANARLSEDYQEFAAAEEARLADEAKEVDDLWDSLERKALGDLKDAMDHIADPKMLLGAAVQANKAQRRANSFGAQKSAQQGSAVINADQLAGPTKVVRLRTKFAEMLSSPDGTKRLVEREAEITAEQGGKVDEAIDPAEVKKLLNGALGIDTQNMRVARTMGPDEAFEGTFVDFDSISDADLPE